jgi:two-component system OmpR family sensor kinase
MTAEDAHRIFERFYRTDSSRDRASGGTGLGLSIVDSLVYAHGGTVGVTTAPGQGCRFTVRLPRIADVDSARTPARPALPAQP